MPHLSVNVDHVATVRQARREGWPDPLAAARWALSAGADGITAHLREDRRHIQESDCLRLRKLLARHPFNLEMAATPAMVRIARTLRPDSVTLVPERRRELTTEGGLNVRASRARLAQAVAILQKAGIAVYLFIDPDLRQIHAAAALNPRGVELHTGRYASAATAAARKTILHRLSDAADGAHELGLEVHAGHGLRLDNVSAVARLKHISGFYIGFAIVARALWVGWEEAVREMRKAVDRPQTLNMKRKA